MMSAFLLGQVWMMAVGALTAVIARRHTLSVGAWMGAIFMAVLPGVMALGLELRPETGHAIGRVAPEMIVVTAESVRSAVAAPTDWVALATRLYLGVAVGLALLTTLRLARLHMVAHRGERVAPDLRLTTANVPPLALGWPTQSVLIPSALWAGLSKEERTLLLAHERSHLTRRDPDLTFALLLFQAANWANPGLRALISGWREAVEWRADAAALATGGSPRTYARLLGTQLAGQSSAPVPTALMAPHTRSAKMRLIQIAKPHHLTRLSRAGLGLGLLSGVGVISALAADTATLDPDIRVTRDVYAMVTNACTPVA